MYFYFVFLSFAVPKQMISKKRKEKDDGHEAPTDMSEYHQIFLGTQVSFHFAFVKFMFRQISLTKYDICTKVAKKIVWNLFFF